MNNKPSAFELYPAIDLMAGKPVRLTKGNFETKNEYALSFKEIIEQFETFASGIHIIDLDGAKSGKLKNRESLETIIKTTQLPIQLGGGIRTFETMQQCSEMGVQRVIIGTNALINPDLVQRFKNDFGSDRVMISVDVKQGKVMTKGWTESNEIGAVEFIENQMEKGFRNFMVTDIEQDGTLQGASVELYQTLKNKFPDIYLLAAGGVGTMEDLQNLRNTGINGAIFGKAFYESKISKQSLNQFKNVK